MADDITLFGIEVDEDLVRRVLAALPGVDPIPPEDLADDAVGADDGPVAADDESAPGVDEPTRADDGPAATGGNDRRAAAGGPRGRATDRAGAPADADGSTGDPRRRTGSERGDPDTPWPGSPFDTGGADESGGRNWKRILLAVGLVLGLGVIGVAIVWGLREWRSDESSDDSGRSGESSDAGNEGTGPLDAAASAMREDDGGSAAESETAEERKRAAAEAAAERSPPMNVSPVVGIAFLAGVTVVLKRLYGDGED